VAGGRLNAVPGHCQGARGACSDGLLQEGRSETVVRARCCGRGPQAPSRRSLRRGPYVGCVRACPLLQETNTTSQKERGVGKAATKKSARQLERRTTHQPPSSGNGHTPATATVPCLRPLTSTRGSQF